MKGSPNRRAGRQRRSERFLFKDPLGIWMILLANRSGNRTYSGAGAPRGAPTEEGAVARRFLPSCEALFADKVKYISQIQFHKK